jgi:pimeloyl-ACP methyl ester carboxylesterase
MRQRRVAAGAVTLAVTEWPTAGPPLVLLHGIGSRAASWLPVAPMLGERFHLYAPDLRGHGESDKPDRGYGIPDYAADLAALLDTLGLERPLVLGHSLGSLVALEWAAGHPGRAARIALEDPPLRTEPGILDAFDGWQALNAMEPDEAAAHFRVNTPSGARRSASGGPRRSPGPTPASLPSCGRRRRRTSRAGGSNGWRASAWSGSGCRRCCCPARPGWGA